MPGPFDQGWRRVIVCGGGPSFTVAQAEQIEAARAAGLCRVLAINATALAPDPERGRPVGLPNADAVYGADTSFWNTYGERLKASSRGQLWTRSKVSADKFGLRCIAIENRDGLTKNPTALATGGNSGYSGINLAYLFGMLDGALVGFDMKLGPDDRTHHHGKHDGNLANPTQDSLAAWVKRFGALARDLDRAGVRVVNCSIDTALTCFPRANLADVLERWRLEQLETA